LENLPESTGCLGSSSPPYRIALPEDVIERQ
jgi:hypothetical protein